MLELKQVKKEYGDKLIVSIPNLTLSAGIYWLNGINGSGKTTLLKMIAGLIPFTGEILLEGISLKKQPVEYRRRVSNAEAEPVYPPFLTGLELIRFHQDIRKATNSTTEQLIERLGFGQFLSAPIGTYSSGMTKRLSLLLAFIGQTKLILLDEPLATLDAEAVTILPQLMMEYRKAFNTLFIFSSHAAFPDEKLMTGQKLLLNNQSLQLIA